MAERVVCPIWRLAEIAPDRVAVISADRFYTYRQLDEMVSGVAAHFIKNGISKGVHVPIQGRNSIEYIVVLLALWRIGAVGVMVPPERSGNSNHITTSIKQKPKQKFLEVQEPFFKKVPGRRRQRYINLANDAVVILTSGSIGERKGVMLAYSNLYYSALGSNENIEIGIGDRWLLSLPLYHVGGIGVLFRSFLVGAVVVVPEREESILESIYRYGVTHLSLVSTQLWRLLKEVSGINEVRGIKAMLLGGSAISKELIQQAISMKFPVYTTYGLSEMGSQVTTTRPGDGLEKCWTSGKLLNYREMKIGEGNEIFVRGKTLFRGYVEEGKMIRPFDEEGWFGTGDIGDIDSEGYLRVLGRKDNMFISGGENIMPEEIEGELDRIPGIERSIVVPVESEEYGFRPVAFIKSSNTEGIDVGFINSELRKRLPGFKIPDAFYIWPEGVGEDSLKVKRSEFDKKGFHPG